MTEKHLVWHDLITANVETAKRFYTQLLGWQYKNEHAVDFAWSGAEADYPLIIASGVAHGGLIEFPNNQPAYWLPYFEVGDVDAVAGKAEQLGATIERDPFDVAGVGRNAVIRDPQRALFCPHTPSHDYPPPHGVFLWDQLFTPSIQQAMEFYESLLGIIPPVTPSKDQTARWIPILATDKMSISLPDVERSGAVLGYETDVPGLGHVEFLTDPGGAHIGIALENKDQDSEFKNLKLNYSSSTQPS